MPLLFVRRHLPNALTVLRLFIAAAFFLALNQFRYPGVNPGWANLAIAIFIVGALTDLLDGWLARRWGVESAFGRLMDPFVDKVLVLGAFIYLAGPRFALPRGADPEIVDMASEVYPWMVVIIFARELLVTTIRGSLESRGFSGGAKWSGKAKMFLQSITVPIVIWLVANIDPYYPGNEWALWTCRALVYLTVIVTVVSAVPYVLAVRSLLGRPSGGAPQSPPPNEAGP
jgi:CDP-diacylglycerol---glycerol-3-phosphate 3-phosphatidyltransferase